MHDSALAQEALRDLPADIGASPLFSADLAPVPQGRRTWRTYNFAALWISMAHCIPTYMFAGGLVAAGMNWWQALLTIAVGNLIVLVPILLNAHPGTKYGVPFPVLARASFGTSGANIPAVLRALVACGWFGINTSLGGDAVKTFLVALFPSFDTIAPGVSILGLSVPSAIAFMTFWLLNIGIILFGMNAIRIFENWAAPIVLVLAGGLLAWIVGKAGGVGPMLSQPSSFKSAGDFFPVFASNVTGMVAFWATLALNIPDFTRFGRGQKEQMVGQALGLPTTMVGFSAMAVVVTSAGQAVLKGVPAEELWKPVTILSYITSKDAPPGLDAPLIASSAIRGIVAVVSLLGVGIATISVNIAANVVSPANDFANLAPKHISFKRGGVITGLLGIAMMPWKLLANPHTYIFSWLGGYGALLAPIAGIMIVDYWIVRKKTLDVADLYRASGRYGRVNGAALVALVAGILPNIPGFLRSVHLSFAEALPSFFDTIFTYACFAGFAVAGGVYYALMSRAPAEKVSA